MSGSHERPEFLATAAPAKPALQSTATAPAAQSAQPAREIGGREGPDPVRFGDWEKSGRCIDF